MKNNKEYSISAIKQRIKDVEPIESGYIKYDEYVFITLIHILPEQERLKLLYHLSKLECAYKGYVKHMQEIIDFCFFLKKIHQNFKFFTKSKETMF